jgi:TFIIF-interacting CTD phosphatase-like protein
MRAYVPNSNKLIPESTAPKGMKTLVLDLDETLVHSSFEELKMADIVLPVHFLVDYSR